jgi:hypothetical protein
VGRDALGDFMGLFDEVEKLTGDAAGQGAEDSLVQKAVQEGEQLLEQKTGGKFDAEIQKGGDLLEQQLDQHLPKP